ncbi:hypothetical protein MKW94_027220 [Papaver nudicaule]|uniref:Pre-mRNA-splicing factor 18 n=1 Tax=Papaver nudicaule TaxID=74823 RepID=A0AA41SLM6_PAPNU|nr:hypothetical protein [Papaver nudicaule]
MDLLREELKRKKQALSALSSDVGGRKTFKRSELEQKKIQQLREEEKKELEAKAKALREKQIDTNDSSNTTSTSSSRQNPKSESSKTPESITEEKKIDDLDLPKQEVIRRLRFLKQPVTLFGEDDGMRMDRLRETLKTGCFEIDNDMTEGQTNDFLRDISELRKRQKTGILSDRKRKTREDGIEDGDGNGGCREDEYSGDGGDSDVDVGKDLKRLKAKFEDLCDEDKILVFFKRLLIEWKQELDDRPDAEKRTGKGKGIVATFKQCARYLNPLFSFCRKKVLPDDIRESLLVVVNCCLERDYLAAMRQYISMAIGNAPWPIGVTMVGIHERSAREKIHTNSVAHIMNDETTRKYLQSVKRLMTFCQRRYPTMPSKAVEFNSLANGSDLQSLLAEEKVVISNQANEEMLRLMPAASREN